LRRALRWPETHSRERGQRLNRESGRGADWSENLTTTSRRYFAVGTRKTAWQNPEMTTVFHTTAEELDESFIASVKAAFKGRAIEIAVSEDDETGYLLRHPANRERLLRAVAEVEAGRNVVTPDQAQFR
jgi:antitoxin YefM